MDIATILPKELQALRQQGQEVDLIDVRTPAEFAEIHADLARNVPLETFDPAGVLRTYPATQRPLYVICRSGMRAKQACQKLVAAGLSNVVNVDGGTLAWAEAGLPVVRGQKAMSLERQVRITAGLLVVIGAVLGLLVNRGFIGLSIFVGCGLIFSGLTDTCPMGMLIARMPWNQGPGAGKTCGTR